METTLMCRYKALVKYRTLRSHNSTIKVTFWMCFVSLKLLRATLFNDESPPRSVRRVVCECERTRSPASGRYGLRHSPAVRGVFKSPGEERHAETSVGDAQTPSPASPCARAPDAAAEATASSRGRGRPARLRLRGPWLHALLFSLRERRGINM